MVGDSEYSSENFRIWLDWELTKKSYVQRDSALFESFQFDGENSKLKVIDLQVWSSGDEQAFEG